MVLGYWRTPIRNQSTQKPINFNWIVIFVLLGLYLIGKIKLYHDSDNQKIGIVRLFLAIASFSFAVAIFPGMFGAPLSWLSGYLPPPSTQEFDIMNRFDKLESENYYNDFPIGLSENYT